MGLKFQGHKKILRITQFDLSVILVANVYSAAKCESKLLDVYLSSYCTKYLYGVFGAAVIGAAVVVKTTKTN